jgi:hypothetical protein
MRYVKFFVHQLSGIRMDTRMFSDLCDSCNYNAFAVKRLASEKGYEFDDDHVVGICALVEAQKRIDDQCQQITEATFNELSNTGDKS